MTIPSPFPLPDTLLPSDVGPYLREVREHFGLSLQHVSEQLHIRVRYLEAMETGHFEIMPGNAYARGYLHSYADFLGLDAEEAVARCFGGSAPSAPPATARHCTRGTALPRHGFPFARWKFLALGLLLLALLGGRAVQWRAEETAIHTPVAVGDVPEALLGEMRTAIMPTPANFDCLMRESSGLPCLSPHPLESLFAYAPPVFLAETAMESMGSIAALSFPEPSEPTP